MVCSGAVATVDVADEVTEGVDVVGEGPSGTPEEWMDAVAVLDGLVSIPLVWLDRSAIATRTTSRANSPTRPVVASREEAFDMPMSACQGADDGGHQPDYLLCHGGEHLVLAPDGHEDARAIKEAGTGSIVAFAPYRACRAN